MARGRNAGLILNRLAIYSIWRIICQTKPHVLTEPSNEKSINGGYERGTPLAPVSSRVPSSNSRAVVTVIRGAIGNACKNPGARGFTDSQRWSPDTRNNVSVLERNIRIVFDTGCVSDLAQSVEIRARYRTSVFNENYNLYICHCIVARASSTGSCDFPDKNDSRNGLLRTNFNNSHYIDRFLKKKTHPITRNEKLSESDRVWTRFHRENPAYPSLIMPRTCREV